MKNNSKKLFILKIGSSLLSKMDGSLNKKYINLVAKMIFENVLDEGNRIIIVTSGAIATGIGILNIKEKPTKISEKQALAAIGQVELMNQYANAFKKYKRNVAQVLLTKSQIEDRTRYLNIKNTIETLLKKGVIPIINENDTVSISEIKFGDNDTLSALVASKLSADLLVILTDVDGVYTSNPRENKNAKLIKNINIEDFKKLNIDFSHKTGSKVGTGGMFTKFKAAQIACFSDVPVLIANGSKKSKFNTLFKFSDQGTLFIPPKKFFNEKQRWIAFSAKTNGFIVIDDGAQNAILNQGKSLLASGVLRIYGNFNALDIVEIKNLKNHVIAKGIIEYSFNEMNNIKGLTTLGIKQNLIVSNIKEVVHRDNMVMFFNYFS